MPNVELEPDESVLFAAGANHSAGARAVGGEITVTDRGLYFTPNRIDAATGGKPVQIARTSVRGVSAAERTSAGGPFSGGLRRRLAVHTDQGSEYFGLNRVDERVDTMRSAWNLPDSPAPPE